MNIRGRLTGKIGVVVLGTAGLLPLWNTAANGADPPGLSAPGLATQIPNGYKVEKTIGSGAAYEGSREYLAALADVREDEIKRLPVMLLLISAGKKAGVEDRVIPHDSTSAEFWKGPPNYVSGLTRESLQGGNLILARTVLSGGGSGSLHFFDFYKVEQRKLRLVRSFSHERMEQTYFAVYRNAIYDADKVCTRGEKHGNAYVYTCYLRVTKYAYDGQAIRPVGSERMREQKGNRYLGDKYWFISVLGALQKNEIFAHSQ